ncbi:MAG TPA: TRAP transporter TatT component family protein, partial [Spirochaetota bacterium]|nr:TRAP transporter TatT component family protein [Spirochaetota bacterium]
SYIMRKIYAFLAPVLMLGVVFLASCTLIINRMGDSLSSQSGGNTFTMDDDPELIGQALPFALKMYETLLDKSPKNANLHLTTASGFVSYANAFVETPAMMMTDDEFTKKQAQLQRAKRLYIRGRDYALKGIELRHKGFLESIERDDFTTAFIKFTPDDVPFMYWAAAGWMAAYAVDGFDFELGTTISRAVAIMKKALELDEKYDNGAIHDFFISFYGALPESMGGSLEKAKIHFERAIELSEGCKASPYVSYAATVSIKKQDEAEFTSLLEKALEIDINAKPESRLANVIAQRKAQWYLDHKEDKFLLGSE